MTARVCVVLTVLWGWNVGLVTIRLPVYSNMKDNEGCAKAASMGRSLLPMLSGMEPGATQALPQD